MNDLTIEQTEEAVRTIEKVIIEEFGHRCPDYEPYCPVCEAWLHFDGIKHAVNYYIDTQETMNKKENTPKWVAEDYPEATEEQKANLIKLFMEV